MRPLSHIKHLAVCIFAALKITLRYNPKKMENMIPEETATCYYFKGFNCSVCTVLEPKVAELMRTRFPKINYRLIEPDTAPELAARMHVFSAPTILVLLDGKEILRKGKTLSIPEFENELQRYYDLFFS